MTSTNICRKVAQTFALIALGLGVINAKPAMASQLTVSAQANIYGAGHTTAPAPGGGIGGQLPTIFNLSASAGQVITFSNVSGAAYYAAQIPYNAKPDGGSFLLGTNISSFGGISGIRNDNAIAFLVGVFLSDNEPVGLAPSILNFTNNTSFTELTPQINQTFFIGDGLTGTGSGSLQSFIVPENATRLALGFADGFSVQGLPGHYSDNYGSVTVELNLKSVPEPSAILGLLTTVGLGIAIKRKHRQGYANN
ncbi:PEP-CTERM sorting domain-containing protein [Nostoc sp.]|uniref:PEP-CTERM sorting domain-containing protein n=1 Tax=Nostoc sp. TaxID=1180 RepID=UPI002FF5B919